MPTELIYIEQLIELHSATASLLLPLACSILIYFSIRSIRYEHPERVYTLWYMFSLALCSESTIFFYWYNRYIIIGNADPLDKFELIIKSYMNITIDISGEFGFVVLLITLGLLPQLLSYLISGLFGCGSPPRFVIAMSRFVTWSLIKFFSFLSGILTAEDMFSLYGKPIVQQNKAAPRILEAFLMIVVSFLATAIYYKSTSVSLHGARQPRFKWLKLVHRSMTQYTRLKPPAGEVKHMARKP